MVRTHSLMAVMQKAVMDCVCVCVCVCVIRRSDRKVRNLQHASGALQGLYGF
jgi:hypothetical protein